MAIPKPGKPVRGSKTGQPIMALFDLLGRSWAMGIIWHLYKGPSTFRKLQEYCESISPTTLNKRLKELTGILSYRTFCRWLCVNRTGKGIIRVIVSFGKMGKNMVN